jgi:hypothetical protein
MELIGAEFIQFLVMQIPNFAGFVILSAVLMRINGRLLEMLKAELEDCRENREREQIMLMQPRRTPSSLYEEDTQRPNGLDEGHL